MTTQETQAGTGLSIISVPAGIKLCPGGASFISGIDTRRALRWEGGEPHLRVHEHITVQQTSRTVAYPIYSIADPLDLRAETHVGCSRGQRPRPNSGGREAWKRCTLIDEKNCAFCKDRPPELRTGDGVHLRPNPFPFGPLVHQMVVSNRHVQQPDDLSEQLMIAVWEQLHKLSCTHQATVEGATIGLNFGAYVLCGASQPHFHYSFAGVGPGNGNAGDAVAEICRLYEREHAGRDYQEDYLAALHRAGLVVAQNTHGVLYVPIAQRFKHELQIMPLAPGVGDLVLTTPDQRAGLARLEYIAHTIHAGIANGEEAEVQAFNVIWYTTRFGSPAVPKQRLVVALAPRTEIVAFYELLGNFVVDVLPWNSASQLRGIAQGIAQEGALPAGVELV